MTIAAALSLAAWIYLLFGRGYFWRVRSNLNPLAKPTAQTTWPRIAAVIPARDEADVIGQAVQSVLAMADGPVAHVIAVDDGSSDGTGEAAVEAARALGEEERLTVVAGAQLATGWTGKLWALQQGVEHAKRWAPEYLLFTDADVVHDPSDLRALVSIAEQGGYDLASLMVRLHCQSLAETLLIPPFVYFFLQLYPPAWVAKPRARTAGGAGGCLLIRTSALDRIGGLASIRGEVIDDCSLARRVKRSGGRIRMKLARGTRSIRPYDGFAAIGRMIARTAFRQLEHSALLLVGTLMGLTLIYLAPIAGLFGAGRMARVFALTAYLLMGISYLPTVRLYKRRVAWCLTLPAATLFYAGATAYSAFRYWRGQGGQWKGRVQDARKTE